MSKTIIITGGGGGVGRATAHAFLDAGWRVGLVGRRAEALEETANGHENALALPCELFVACYTGAFFAALSFHLPILRGSAYLVGGRSTTRSTRQLGCQCHRAGATGITGACNRLRRLSTGLLGRNWMSALRRVMLTLGAHA